MSLRTDADQILVSAIRAVQPDAAVMRALRGRTFPKDGRLLLVAVGKAAWSMAAAAKRVLGDAIDGGIVITKHGYAKGAIDGLTIFEAGHPVPDEDTYSATRAVLAETERLTKRDTVLFLLSGGGSALMESPLLPPDELADITRQLLQSGADIVEMNTIRKRLSAVKGGRFAQHCAPARVFSIVLSDIVGDPLDMIASGPACPDSATAADALRVANRYHLRLSAQAEALLHAETPKSLNNVETLVTGSVRALCTAAADAALSCGYAPTILTDSLTCEAREAGAFLAALARYRQDTTESIALLCGGETIVHVQGTGLGGRNQELALAAAAGIRDLPGTAVFSAGSDGTDGPTDAAGGYVDGNTCARLEAAGVSLIGALADNDAYHALAVCDGLLVTGPTGTNVNDVSVVLIRR